MENNEKDNVFKIFNDEGKEVECEVLFTFESDETHKNYMVYTDNTKDEQGNTKVFASIFDPTKETTVLEPIESEKEWNIIENILESLQNKETTETETGTGNEQ